jgi:hypothetical protein
MDDRRRRKSFQKAPETVRGTFLNPPPTHPTDVALSNLFGGTVICPSEKFS